MLRHYTLLDKFINQCDQALRTVFIFGHHAQRPSPANNINSDDHFKPAEQQHVAGLMRVNHTGEVCAQALYQGQALTARLDQVREKFAIAAAEETDHLAWCEQRLKNLNSHPSYLNPLWYLGAFTIGAVAGWLGDRWSLGFVAETEDQVTQHLQKHLDRLPPQDKKTRAILQQMHQDEAGHAAMARTAGAYVLPSYARAAMRFASKIMTSTAYYI